VAKRKQKLKVFKTPIGFHDAYVAAPSRKAALEAWGAGTDLFSAGIAEEVTAKSKGSKAALAKPGDVVRVGRRGGEDEVRPSTRSGRMKEARKSKPSRAALDKAEAALAELDRRQAAERAALAKEEEKLARKRRALEERQSKERDKAEARREAAEKRDREALGRG
jgi:hypothetical protein